MRDNIKEKKDLNTAAEKFEALNHQHRMTINAIIDAFRMEELMNLPKKVG